MKHGGIAPIDAIQVPRHAKPPIPPANINGVQQMAQQLPPAAGPLKLFWIWTVNMRKQNKMANEMFIVNGNLWMRNEEIEWWASACYRVMNAYLLLLFSKTKTVNRGWNEDRSVGKINYFGIQYMCAPYIYMKKKEKIPNRLGKKNCLITWKTTYSDCVRVFSLYTRILEFSKWVEPLWHHS